MKKLKIYYTSDVHGYFYPTSYGDTIEKPMGLFACADGFVKDEHTLIMDGGDMLQGSALAYYCKNKLATSEQIAAMVNDLGYDYYCIGNHDFNYGLEYQKIYRDHHKGTCLCQNVCDENGKILYPYVIREMPDGLRIGIVGIVTDFVNVWEKEENIEGLRITDPFAAAKEALEELRGQVDLTIGIYHGGFENDLTTGERLSKTTENVGYKICQELDFDILLTGHQHMSVDGRMVNGTYVVQPLDRAREYFCVEVTVDGDKKEITSTKHVPGDVIPNGAGEKLREKYQPLEDEIQKWLDQPLGHLSRPLLPEDKVTMALHGSPIADFINRIQLHFSGAQLSVVGLANEIAGFRSEVSTRDVIATYPFPNTLVVCEITGARLKAVMERSAEYFALDADGNVVVAESFLHPKVEHYNYDYYAGVDYRIDPTKPHGSRIVELTYRGKPVADTDTFTLCLNNYRYSGAGGYEVYRECPGVREINVEMVELIMDYLGSHDYIEV